MVECSLYSTLFLESVGTLEMLSIRRLKLAIHDLVAFRMCIFDPMLKFHLWALQNIAKLSLCLTNCNDIKQ